MENVILWIMLGILGIFIPALAINSIVEVEKDD